VPYAHTPAFVAGAPLFSLATQAYFFGGTLSPAAAQFGLSNGHLLILPLPHAMIELTALFLPLAAWLVASRRGDWDQLLAATFVTVAVILSVVFVVLTLEVRGRVRSAWRTSVRCRRPRASGPARSRRPRPR